MSIQFWADSAACKRQFKKLFPNVCYAILLTGVLAAAGCTYTPRASVTPDPSDPGVRVPPVGYRSTLGSYRSQRPVEPGDWIDTNERIAPPARPGR